MLDTKRLDEMTAPEMQSVLAAPLGDLSCDQVANILDFVARIGGISNAGHAVSMLLELEDRYLPDRCGWREA